MPIHDATSIQIPAPTALRLKRLAADRAKRLGLTKLSQRVLIEMLISEEEERLKHESQN